MGNIEERFPSPPADAKPPANGCLFMGARSPFEQAVWVDAKIKDAQGLGFTDIRELDVPPCDPAKDPFGCTIKGGNQPTKYVWACQAKQASTPAAPPPAGTPVSTPGQPPPASAAPSSNTPLIVGGGLAAAGLLAFLAFR